MIEKKRKEKRVTREDTCLDVARCLARLSLEASCISSPAYLSPGLYKTDPPAHVTIDAEIRRRSSLLILENGERNERKNYEL